MTASELLLLFEKLAKYGICGLIAGLVVFILVKNYMAGYLSKKGENLATKEDIAQLTKLVKDVEHSYNVRLEEIKARQQLRMAAVDKRFQAHQDAFTIWYTLVVSGPKGPSHAVMQCRNWWNENCLYLEPEVRQAFLEACEHAMRAEGLTKARAHHSEIFEASRRIMDFPEVLFKAVKLPAFSQVESKMFSRSVETTDQLYG